MNPSPTIAVCADPPGDAELERRASQLASQLGLPIALASSLDTCDMLLAVTPERLELRVLRGPANLQGGKAVTCDWSKIDVTSPAGRRLNQPLLRAVGIHKGDRYRPHILDATAGFGEDAWLLAAMGCRVTAVERSTIMAALLDDALCRVKATHPQIAHRLEIIHADSIEHLTTIDADHAVDVVYLDPMFPTGRKTLERKPMRVARRLVGSDTDAGELLVAALHAAGRRVVVKRPLKGSPLAANLVRPTTTHKARGVRYDVYAAPPGGAMTAWRL